uniref:Uncharacterized protein n=1 Tax=Anopheles atroparvus TaxID=41427 RepID=A0AAG5D595_ANOAO
MCIRAFRKSSIRRWCPFTLVAPQGTRIEDGKIFDSTSISINKLNQ